MLFDTQLGILFAFIFGCLIGSFLNVLIWRLPREESINGRSHCPKCNHTLIWIDLIPVVSILLFRAKCRYCKEQISLRYPFFEVLTGALFAFAWYYFSPYDFASVLLFAKAAIVLAVCIVVFVIDFEHYLILDKVVFPASVLMVLFAIALHTYGNIFAGIVGFIPFWFIWYISKGKWMGFGDAKFAGFMGLVLGLPSLVVALFLSFGIGALVGILLIFAGKKDLGSKLPFGTFLTISTILALFYGQKLWDLYMSLL